MDGLFQGFTTGLQIGNTIMQIPRNRELHEARMAEAQQLQQQREMQMESQRQQQALRNFEVTQRRLQPLLFDASGMRRGADSWSPVERRNLVNELNADHMKSYLARHGIVSVQDIRPRGDGTLELVFTDKVGRAGAAREDLDDLMGTIIRNVSSYSGEQAQGLAQAKFNAAGGAANLEALNHMSAQGGLSAGAPPSGMSMGGAPTTRTSGVQAPPNNGFDVDTRGMTEASIKEVLAAIRSVYPDTVGVRPVPGGAWMARRASGETVTVPPEMLTQIKSGEAGGLPEVSAVDLAATTAGVDAHEMTPGGGGGSVPPPDVRLMMDAARLRGRDGGAEAQEEFRRQVEAHQAYEAERQQRIQERWRRLEPPPGAPQDAGGLLRRAEEVRQQRHAPSEAPVSQFGVDEHEMTPGGGGGAPDLPSEESRGLWGRITDRLNQDSAAALDPRIPHSFGSPPGGVATPEMHEGLAAAQESWRQRPEPEAPDFSQMSNQELLQMRREIPWHRRVALGSELDAELIRRQVGLGQRIGDSARNAREAVTDGVGGVGGFGQFLLQRGQQGVENVRAGFEGRDPKDLALERDIQRLLATEQEPPAFAAGLFAGGPQGGIPPQGMPPQGMPPQGMPPQGMPPQGMPPQGMPPRQHRQPPNGLWDALSDDARNNFAMRAHLDRAFAPSAENLARHGSLSAPEAARADWRQLSGDRLFNTADGRMLDFSRPEASGPARPHELLRDTEATAGLLGLDLDTPGGQRSMEQFMAFTASVGEQTVASMIQTPDQQLTMRHAVRLTQQMEKEGSVWERWRHPTIRHASIGVAYNMLTSGAVSAEATPRDARKAFREFERRYLAALPKNAPVPEQEQWIRIASGLEGLGYDHGSIQSTMRDLVSRVDAEAQNAGVSRMDTLRAWSERLMQQQTQGSRHDQAGH